MTPAIKLALRVSVVLFTASALAGIYWRWGIAEAWLNRCLEMVSQPVLQTRFGWHFLFFVFGLLSIGVLVSLSALSRSTELPSEK
jgi:hypothetical protein